MSLPQVGSNYSNFYDSRYPFHNDSYQQQETSGTEKKGVKHALSEWSEKTSVQGVSFLKSSTNIVYKALWTFVLLLAVGATIYQFYFVLYKFLQFDATTNVQIIYGAQDFPTVTICTATPIRRSRMGQLTEEFSELFDDIAYDRQYQFNFDSDSNTTNSRKKRQAPASNTTVFDDTLDEYGELDLDDRAEFLDDFGHGRVSALRQQNIFFKRRFAFLSDDLRREVGIERDPVIFGCEFNGRDCDFQNFSIFQTLDYGNCLQFNSAHDRNRSLKTLKAGSETGLNIQVFVEKAEQIEGLEETNAAHVLIHPFNTTSLVYQLGMPIGTGTYSAISMKRTTVTKLGPPYNKCDDGGDFEKNYKEKYTNKACRATCADRLIADECKCLRAETRDLYSDEDQEKLPICFNTTQLTCTHRIQHDVDRNIRGCNCEQGCSETDYQLTISNSQWPSLNSWFTLANRICAINDEACRRIQSVEVDDRMEFLRENFLSISIYFGDLGELSITEQPEYEIPQFMSDLGGTFGLYIGASVLTFGEIMSLTYTLCSLSKRRSSRKTNPTDSKSQPRRSSPRPPQYINPSVGGKPGSAGLGSQLKNRANSTDGTYMGLQSVSHQESLYGYRSPTFNR